MSHACSIHTGVLTYVTDERFPQECVPCTHHAWLTSPSLIGADITLLTHSLIFMQQFVIVYYSSSKLRLQPLWVTVILCLTAAELHSGIIWTTPVLFLLWRVKMPTTTKVGEEKYQLDKLTKKTVAEKETKGRQQPRLYVCRGIPEIHTVSLGTGAPDLANTLQSGMFKRVNTHTHSAATLILQRKSRSWGHFVHTVLLNITTYDLCLLFR